MENAAKASAQNKKIHYYDAEKETQRNLRTLETALVETQFSGFQGLNSRFILF